jgi:uncharacterized membrane protein YphA (DoxX/SURF4 family)
MTERRRLGALLRRRAGLGVAVLGAVVCLVLARDHGWARLVGGVLVGAAIIEQVVLLVRAMSAGPPAAHSVPRSSALVLPLAVAAWYWSGRPTFAWALVAAVVLLLAVVWLVSGLPALSDEVLHARHLPGAPDEVAKPPRWSSGWIAVGLCAVWVLGFVLGAFAAPAVVFLGVAAIGAGLGVGVWVGYQPVRREQRLVLAAFRALAPAYLMPYNGVAGFHIGMWAPYLERTGRPVAVVTTTEKAFSRISAAYSLPIVYAPSGSRAAVKQLFLPSVRAAFYVFNGFNRVFLAQRGVTHVFLQHGDSDKSGSAAPMTAGYDVIVVAGQAAVDRFQSSGVAISAEKFKILGRPQTAEIRTVDQPISTVADPVVLYAPTWKGKSDEANYSSLLLGEQIVRALLVRGATVIFRPHPAGRTYPPHVAAIAAIKALLAADAKLSGRPHRWGKAAEGLSVAQVTNLADAMVSDVSGIVTDFMQSLKPFAMVATRGTAEEFRTSFPTSRSAYVITTDPATIDLALDAMLGDDPLAAIRAERRQYYLGGFDDGESAEAFADYLETLEASPRTLADVRPSSP